MAAAFEITFRDIDPSEAIEAAIREKARKLEQFHDRITSCRVVVAAPHRHRHKGKRYQISIDLVMPGGQVIVNHEPGDQNAHEDIYVAIRDAFDAAKRQLRNAGRKKSGEVKSHETPPHGRVIRLFAAQGYGFIEAVDGREYYFHKNSVLNASFDKLEVGSEVRFAPEEGVEGPQARSVQAVGKHHLGDFPSDES